MIRYAWTGGFAASVMLAANLLGHAPALRDNEDARLLKAVRKDVLEMARLIEEGKDVKPLAAKMKKQYEELNTIMQVYKPSNRRGGSFPAGPGDGIEVKLHIDAHGQALASLSAEKPQTLDLLQRDSAMLERTLKDAGLDLAGGLSFSLKGDGNQGQGRPAPDQMPRAAQFATTDSASASSIPASACPRRGPTRPTRPIRSRARPAVRPSARGNRMPLRRVTVRRGSRPLGQRGKAGLGLFDDVNRLH